MMSFTSDDVRGLIYLGYLSFMLGEKDCYRQFFKNGDALNLRILKHQNHTFKRIFILSHAKNIRSATSHAGPLKKFLQSDCSTTELASPGNKRWHLFYYVYNKTFPKRDCKFHIKDLLISQGKQLRFDFPNIMQILNLNFNFIYDQNKYR